MRASGRGEEFGQFGQRMEGLLAGLYRAARALTDQQADAEDLVHDTYIRAHEAHENARFATDEAFRAWVYRIMVNLFRDRYRRRARSPEQSVVPPDETRAAAESELAPDDAGDPTRLLERREFAAAVRTAMATLPTEVRLAVTLFFVHDLSYREIAEITGCPVGTVTSRLSRGREMLRHRLNGAVAPDDDRGTASNIVVRPIRSSIRGVP
jgi:RNA polymerase sigma-70 factor, ECF subfamily